MRTASGTEFEKKEMTLVAQDCPISVLSYEISSPRAIILLIHGMCEYKERYAYFMEKLADAGYSSVIYDQRGHGESVVSASDYGYVGKGNSILVSDAHQILQYVKSIYPGKRVFLFGHSMGSLVARCFLKKYDDEISGMVLCGQPYKRGMLGVSSALVKGFELVGGEHNHSTLIDSMAMGEYTHAFSDGLSAWICSDEEVVREYDLDRKCNFRLTLNGYEHLVKLQQSAYSKTGFCMKNAQLPILFIAGANDPCAGDMLHFRESVMSLKAKGYENIKWKRYSGKRHELINETNRDQVIEDVISFYTGILRNK